ncbi:TPA: methyltransferase domain-containing protein [Streptococcus agalactiae]|nr:methyltransferase domain-containing protein [Streptococcus agalactiae]HEO2768761.1 methyltransferase domain-containing protein [Streptococcus agalactiae]
MLVDKKWRFEDSASYFACPKCQNPLIKESNSLKCSGNHCFDLSKFGYVNLLGGKKVDEHYDKKSFENRQLVLENGYYNHILEAISKVLENNSQFHSVLDIGCGEGFYSRQLVNKHEKTFLAFDISKDSIQLAAKSDQSRLVKWFVSDLANLPIQDSSIDIILDIFSPANYKEFRRVLSDDGILVKVVPVAEHVQELREKASQYLKQKDYSNQKILDHFRENFEIISEQKVVQSYNCSQQERQAFIDMTPSLFSVDKTTIDWASISEITVGALIVIGKKRSVSK